MRPSSLPCSTKPLRRGALKRAPLKRSRVKRSAPRDTGPDRKTRGLVLARDNWCCISCGKPGGGAFTWWSIQHRVARGQGGDNSPSNLIVLCGSATTGCHGLCESRDREMHARGYWLESWQDPRAEAVMVFSEDGSGATVWLADDGTYAFEAPGDAA